MPIASPGITLQEKSITAGISPRRVKKEIDRFSMSMIGSALSMFVAFTASFIFPISYRMGLPEAGSASGAMRVSLSSIAHATRPQAGSSPSTKLISAIVGGSAGWMNERSSRLASLIAVPQSGLSGARPRPK